MAEEQRFPARRGPAADGYRIELPASNDNVAGEMAAPARRAKATTSSDPAGRPPRGGQVRKRPRGTTK
ncbi:hypothetical protein GCM10011504_50270 [Siccirubricoccus deserti]|uniref:Uncharacterized protein n=1 Tax=Siccirubricoccus deserti TaxID=2013562 RepID=A0A9X0R2R3_9PROT|nr:hypothetical protein [Siccirubricoccus deserti]MBC4018515.1 hypothetical protein [Siccirubricoccus deserti]GGC66252.1 hypothetical protein GCM10011504_50270 [Siccirubricoccus deserti]